MTPLETLKAARQLISDPAKWTQTYYARDASGYPVPPTSLEAVCFCALGSIEHAANKNLLTLTETIAIIENVALSEHAMAVFELNDTHTHAEVLALFDAAIAELEGIA